MSDHRWAGPSDSDTPPEASPVSRPTATGEAPRPSSAEGGLFSGWSGLFAAFGLIMAVLIGLRLATQHVRSADTLKYIYIGVAGALLSSRALRRSFLLVAVIYALFCASVYAVRNWDNLQAGKISLKRGLQGVVEVGTGIGPGKQLAGLVRDIRARRNAQPSLPSSSDFFATYAPRLDVSQYLQRVDARSAEVNVRASQVVHGCDSQDRLCEATRILSFVTDQIDYRTDPVAQPFAGDYPKPPTQTLAAGAGDCEDKTILLISLLGTIGINSLMVFEEGHAHALVCFDNRIETLMAQRLTAGGQHAIDYLVPVLGPITQRNLETRLTAMAQPLKVGEAFCYAAESTARGSWLGFDKNPQHLGIYNPFNVPSPRVVEPREPSGTSRS